MTTKDKILYTARILFNTNGLINTSVRTICSEMGISAGNFSYHYPSKDKVIEDLYEAMLGEIQKAIAGVASTTTSIIGYLETHKAIFAIQSKYKFVYLNFFEIVVNHSGIKAKHLETIKYERTAAKRLLKMYVANKVVKEGIDEDYFEHVLNVGHLLHNTWLIEAEISFKGNERQKLKYYLSICCGLMEPLLTAKSRRDYKQFFMEL